MEFSEREWKFRLGSEFTTIWGNDYGSSRQTCARLRPNALRCDDRHSEHEDWRVVTTFEFYRLGILRSIDVKDHQKCELRS